MTGVARQSGLYRPEYGDGWADVECDTCGATWVGGVGDPCGWCLKAEERQRADAKQDLLYPAWCVDQGPRYDEITDIDKKVWDATRGITGARDSVPFWARRLRRGVDSGLVTEVEAELAVARVEKWLGE